MKILLIGATGPTGQQILTRALTQGHQVTALARHPERLTVKSEQLLTVQGDVLNEPSLEQAMTGQDAVICALGLSLADSRKPTTVYSTGTGNIITAMDKQGVRRLVCITGIGSGDSRGHGGFFYDRIFLPLILNQGYLDKTRQEEEIKRSNLDWVIIRPAQLTNGPIRDTYRVLLDGNYTAKSISRADVATFVLEQLTSNQYLKKTPVISY